MKPTSVIRYLGSLPRGGEASTSGPDERAGQLNRAGFQMPVHQARQKSLERQVSKGGITGRVGGNL